MKVNKYKLIIAFIIFLLISLNMNAIFAIDTSKFRDVTNISDNDIGSLASVAGKIIFVLQYAGYTVAVIMLAIMGIKYMVSAPNEKADIKTKLMPYLIGALLIFAGSTILKIIYRILT